MNKAYNAWLKTRPKCVQKLAKEFPMGTRVQFGGEMLHLLGWTENDSIILSPINPSEDSDGWWINGDYISELTNWQPLRPAPTGEV